jgi:hemolysin activation/secretion protein
MLRAELAYDLSDAWKGVNQVIFTAHQGIGGLGSTENGNPVASRSNGRVDFFRSTLTLSRTQTLTERHSLYLSAFGQWSDDPLLSSQECGYGGSQYGRAYDSSHITGDKCVTALAELRYNLPQQTLDQVQLYGFTDWGKIWNLQAPAGTAEEDQASSAGLGLRLNHRTLSADLQLSQAQHRPDSASSEDDVRGFFSITARY